MKPTSILASGLLIGATSAFSFSVLECPSSRPNTSPLPNGFNPLSSYGTWTDLCSSTSFQPNAGCDCNVGNSPECTVQDNPVHNDCESQCSCNQVVSEQNFPDISDWPPLPTFDSDSSSDPGSISDDSGSSVGENFPPTAAGSEHPPYNAGVCSTKCSSVVRQCTVGCSCSAPIVSLVFWFQGACTGGTRGLPKRSETLSLHERSMGNHTKAGNASDADLIQYLQQYYANETIAALKAGQVPAPCNSSYVSFACANSTDGIVHESPMHWLGAVLPANMTENSTTLPTVPANWLAIRGLHANHTVHNRRLLH